MSYTRLDDANERLAALRQRAALHDGSRSMGMTDAHDAAELERIAEEEARILDEIDQMTADGTQFNRLG